AAVHPVVPGKGSIGVADLAPLSHMALPLLAEGTAEYRGEILSAAEALSRAGLAPVALAAKDGLALISSNAASVGCAALALHDATAALDALGIGLTQAAATSVERCLKLFSPAFSDLPLQLTRHGPMHSGFATVQKTLTALYNEIRHAANPASRDFLPVSEAVEDHAPMTPHAIAKSV